MTSTPLWLVGGGGFSLLIVQMFQNRHKLFQTPHHNVSTPPSAPHTEAHTHRRRLLPELVSGLTCTPPQLLPTAQLINKL